MSGAASTAFWVFVGVFGLPVLACLFVAFLEVAQGVADRWRRREGVR